MACHACEKVVLVVPWRSHWSRTLAFIGAVLTSPSTVLIEASKSIQNAPIS